MLEEDLVLAIWIGVETVWKDSKNSRQDKPAIDINRMLKIYPVSINSSSAFIKSLTLQIH